MGLAVGEFVFGVAVGMFFKDRIVAFGQSVKAAPGKAWAGFKNAIGVKAKAVEGNVANDVAALQAKVDAIFGKGLVAVTVAPVAAAPVAVAQVAPATVAAPTVTNA